MPEHGELVSAISRWFDDHARQLPWRGDDVDPWAVMVSEFMLQQTPVARVIPVFESWMARWPTPDDLAAASSGDAVRMWGKLGYPRRALRLHAAACTISEQYHGFVPSDVHELRRLPGVGDYTAAAIAAFAYGQRVAVVDTNVRRVLHRSLLGAAEAGPATTRADFELAGSILPCDPREAAHFSAAIMELGALVCTASNPRCTSCPLVDRCAWLAAGKPEYAGPAKKVQQFAGTDRQVRGLLMDVLRDAEGHVPKDRLDVVWPDENQRERALTSLITDGLAIVDGLDYRLPR